VEHAVLGGPGGAAGPRLGHALDQLRVVARVDELERRAPEQLGGLVAEQARGGGIDEDDRGGAVDDHRIGSALDERAKSRLRAAQRVLEALVRRDVAQHQERGADVPAVVAQRSDRDRRPQHFAVGLADLALADVHDLARQRPAHLLGDLGGCELGKDVARRLADHGPRRRAREALHEAVPHLVAALVVEHRDADLRFGDDAAVEVDRQRAERRVGHRRVRDDAATSVAANRGIP
jgi:hypothetical protein